MQKLGINLKRYLKFFLLILDCMCSLTITILYYIFKYHISVFFPTLRKRITINKNPTGIDMAKVTSSIIDRKLERSGK